MTRDDVIAASRRLAGKVVRTPTLRCPALDEVAGAQVWLKCENLQLIGAFKARGAMHAVGRLTDEQRQRGIITFSSGNHAQAVALAAKSYGIVATIAMPVDAPEIKVAGVRSLGAEIVPAGTTSDDRRKVAYELAEATGATIIQPFDHPDIIAGQGTATLELVEDIPRPPQGPGLDALVVPVGGGGLIAGACLAVENTDIPVYSAEPTGCDALARSLEAGKRVAVPPGPTLADGLKPVQVGELNFAIAQKRVRRSYRVTDEELGLTLTRLLVRAKILVEPSGAAALAVALRGDLPRNPARIGVLLSGGNIAPQLVAKLVERYGSQV